MDSSHVTPIYPNDINTGKGLLGCVIRNYGATLKALVALLPIFLVIGVLDSFLVRTLTDYAARVGVQLILGLLNGFAWCTALCLLHQRYVGHIMPLNKAFAQAVRHFFNAVLVVVCYGALIFVYYEIMLLVQYVFHFFKITHMVKLVMMAVMLVLCFLYVLASVMLIMGFATSQIEKLPIWPALKRSNALVQAGWFKSFVQYVLFALMLLIVIMPQSLGFAQRWSLLKLLITQAVFAAVIVPAWLSWYLLSYNDLKLCELNEDD